MARAFTIRAGDTQAPPAAAARTPEPSSAAGKSNRVAAWRADNGSTPKAKLTSIPRRSNMNIGSKATRVSAALVFFGVLWGLYQLGAGPARVALAAGGSMNGAAGQMPAFYDCEQFTVNMKEMPEPASAALLAKNPSINKIYATNDLDEEQDFFPVLDAIQGDGFNPLWQQILIHFTGSVPHQFCSDDEVLEAADAGEITLEPTDEMYRCSVVGPK
jgi:hypothetical protein